jgi:hypothetical protein
MDPDRHTAVTHLSTYPLNPALSLVIEPSLHKRLGILDITQP